MVIPDLNIIHKTCHFMSLKNKMKSGFIYFGHVETPKKLSPNHNYFMLV